MKHTSRVRPSLSVFCRRDQLSLSADSPLAYNKTDEKCNKDSVPLQKKMQTTHLQICSHNKIAMSVKLHLTDGRKDGLSIRLLDGV